VFTRLIARKQVGIGNFTPLSCSSLPSDHHQLSWSYQRWL